MRGKKRTRKAGGSRGAGKEIEEQMKIETKREDLHRMYDNFSLEFTQTGTPTYQPPKSFKFNTFNPYELPEDEALAIVSYGKRRTGKSFWTNWYLCCRQNYWDEIYVFTQTKNGVNNKYEKALEDVFIFDKWDQDKLQAIFAGAEEYLKENGKPARILIILEDMISDKKVKHSEFINALFTRGRHHGFTVIFHTQRPTAVLPVVRNNCDIAVIFNQLSVKDLQCLAEIYMGRLNKTTAAELITMYTQDNNALVIELWKNSIIPEDYIKTMKAYDPGKFRMKCCEEYHRQAEEQRQQQKMGGDSNKAKSNPEHSKQSLNLMMGSSAGFYPSKFF